ncbi:MAG: hypothetical protein ACXWW0_00220 [Bacteroidia bacterium]
MKTLKILKTYLVLAMPVIQGFVITLTLLWLTGLTLYDGNLWLMLIIFWLLCRMGNKLK